MTRLLLALVALLTGLAVQSAPAAARICAAGTEVGVMEVERREGAVAVRALPGGIPLARQATGLRDRPCAIARAKQIYIPSVQLGIDISHE